MSYDSLIFKKGNDSPNIKPFWLVSVLNPDSTIRMDLCYSPCIFLVFSFTFAEFTILTDKYLPTNFVIPIYPSIVFSFRLLSATGTIFSVANYLWPPSEYTIAIVLVTDCHRAATVIIFTCWQFLKCPRKPFCPNLDDGRWSQQQGEREPGINHRSSNCPWFWASANPTGNKPDSLRFCRRQNGNSQ